MAKPKTTKKKNLRTAKTSSVKATKPKAAKVSSRPPKASSKRRFFYPIFSLLVLFGTTLFWAINGANIQLNNSDQLINPMLTSSWPVFKHASFPGVHSMLIKWPLFWLIQLIGIKPFSYDLITVLTLLATIGLLVYILYKIDRRPEVFGTLCLALAGCLLLIPAQPSNGGLLPVNMAMLATRNIEYVIFLGSLILIFRKTSFKSWTFWLGSLLLGLLVASDKLFLSLSAIGGLLALGVYLVFRKWDILKKGGYWLAGSIVAGGLGTLILWAINKLRLTQISGQASASPFQLVSSAHQVGLSIFYSISSFFTNFGANPAFDGLEARNIPHLLAKRLFSYGGPAFIINFLVVVATIWAAFKLIKISLEKNSAKRTKSLDKYALVAIALIFCSIVAFGNFILTNHAYTVDARYLTICIFCLFIVLAVVARSLKFKPEYFKPVVIILCVGIISGLFMSAHINNDQANALDNIADRDSKVASVLKTYPVDTLIGDYWRVPEVKLDSQGKVNIIPTTGCTAANIILSSSSWQINLHTHSFAFLLPLSGQLVNTQHCSINNVIAEYGKPNRSVLIAGTYSNPQEHLLIYQHGIRKTPNVVPSTAASTVLPISIQQLPNVGCSSSTVMIFVAHEDDDLLFMNPDLSNDIAAGDCVRSVYLTAGDAGNNSYYWLGREKGSEAAYNYMLGSIGNVWVDHTVDLGSKHYVSVDNPKGNKNISLIFMHLPDGNLKGQGFASSGYQSLAKLWAGTIPSMETIDHQSTYTTSDLETALVALMNAFKPTQIYTQSNYNFGPYPDHSDHQTVSHFVKKAYASYESALPLGQSIPISFYTGYPGRNLPANVGGATLVYKATIFVTYAGSDGGVCQSVAKCLSTPTYGRYLARQYTYSY